MAVPTFGKSKLPRTHDECRALVCCVCSKKVKKNQPSMPVISEKYSNLVKKFVFDGYTTQNTLYPTALCGSCRLTLTAMDKVFIILYSMSKCQSMENYFYHFKTKYLS